MSDTEPEYVPDDQDEIDNDIEEEYDEEDDEYEEAIENYARMLREVPEEKLNGIVEQVDEIFNNMQFPPENNNDSSLYLFILVMVILMTSAIVRGYIDSKTNYINQ